MNRIQMIVVLIIFSFQSSLFANITPHKYTDKIAHYEIPVKATKFVSIDERVEPIQYYISFPGTNSYPIAIVCEGSSVKGDLTSVIHFHRYFLQEFLDCGCAVISCEQIGIRGNEIDEKLFFEHYTRSQRLNDHIALMDHLIANPPIGWNGKFVLFGVSEGGPLVNDLAAYYQDKIIATINIAGAGDFCWADEFWNFFCDLRKNGPLWLRLWDAYYPRFLPGCSDIPKTRDEYDRLVKTIIENPTTQLYFGGLTYKYWSDAFSKPSYGYSQFKTPLLVVTGALDCYIESSDLFVKKANDIGCPITYFRIDGMDHYIRKQPDVQKMIFEWLKNQL